MLIIKNIMPPGILNEENPLTKYKRANPYVSWIELSKKTGLSNQTLIAIAQRDIKQVRALSIETYLIIKDIMSIDLLDESLWGNGYEQNKDIKTTK